MQLRGLFGELWFLRTVAIPSVGSLAAVHAWKGPLGSPQDFQLLDGLVEIKTILPGGHKEQSLRLNSLSMEVHHCSFVSTLWMSHEESPFKHW